jgi:hypothetical protein
MEFTDFCIYEVYVCEVFNNFSSHLISCFF